MCRTAVKVELELIGQVPVAHTRAQLYNLACFYSRASAAVKADPQKAEEHAAQAVALLRKAQRPRAGTTSRMRKRTTIWTRSATATTFAGCSKSWNRRARSRPTGRSRRPEDKGGPVRFATMLNSHRPAAPERLRQRAQGINEPMLRVFPCLRQRKRS